MRTDIGACTHTHTHIHTICTIHNTYSAYAHRHIAYVNLQICIPKPPTHTQSVHQTDRKTGRQADRQTHTHTHTHTHTRQTEVGPLGCRCKVAFEEQEGN